MYKPYISNRIIENEYEIYKNKLLYTALKNMKPITKTYWVHDEFPMSRMKPFLEIRDRNRINGFINIAQENLKFFSKLQKSKSTYSLEKYMNDFAKNKKYSSNLRKCRNLSVLRLNSTRKPKFAYTNNPFNDKKQLSYYNNYHGSTEKNIKNITTTNFNRQEYNNEYNDYRPKKNRDDKTKVFNPYFSKIFTITNLGECLVEIFSQKIK